MKIAIIGAGAMGGATVEGLIKMPTINNGDITVSDPSQAVHEKFSAQGVNVTSDNREAVKGAEIVCVFVKPWLVEQVLKGVADVLQPQRQILVVIAAGVPSDHIRSWLRQKRNPLHEEMEMPLFLMIPNIAMAQLQSMTFLVPVVGEPCHTKLIENVFGQMGRILITDEEHLAAGTTLASCGIAYAMRYIRAASEGGVELGFKADDAKRIVMQTMRGAIELLEATGLHPEAAIDLVTTPDGVTIKGLNEMERAGFTSSVIRGLKAGLK